MNIQWHTEAYSEPDHAVRGCRPLDCHAAFFFSFRSCLLWWHLSNREVMKMSLPRNTQDLPFNSIWPAFTSEMSCRLLTLSGDCYAFWCSDAWRGAEEMYWWEIEVLSQAIYRSSSFPYEKKKRKKKKVKWITISAVACRASSWGLSACFCVYIAGKT